MWIPLGEETAKKIGIQRCENDGRFAKIDFLQFHDLVFFPFRVIVHIGCSKGNFMKLRAFSLNLGAGADELDPAGRQQTSGSRGLRRLDFGIFWSRFCAV